MKRIAFLPVTIARVAGVAASMVTSFGRTSEVASPVYGVRIAPGYRDWELISDTHEEGDFNQLRVQLGNEKCFPCHIPAEATDYVFTRYAP